MNWVTQSILMMFVEAIYFASAFGAWGFCHLHYHEIKMDAFSRAAHRTNKHLRWGKRNELLYLILMFFMIVTPLLNTFLTIRVYQGRGWKKKR